MRFDRHHLRAWLKGGGIVAYATESCFGLGCDPRNARALARLLRLKGRPRQKGLIVIGAEVGQLRGLLAEGVLATTPYQDYWPGANTLLLPAGPQALGLLRGQHRRLAVRIPGHAGARALCRAAGMALVSTSANLSGRVSLKTARACSRQFGRRVLVIGGRNGGARRPSAIIDLDSGQRLR